MLTEEVSHEEDGVAFSFLVATWDKPAGLIFPETIRLIHNGTTVSLAGTATSYRMPGYLIGDTVTVNVTAISKPVFIAFLLRLHLYRFSS